MTNTFVYDDRAVKRPGMAVGYDVFGQLDDGSPTAIPGDGGIYSTVDDLFKWDQALYTDKLVRQSTLAEAFTPGRVKKARQRMASGGTWGSTALANTSGTQAVTRVSGPSLNGGSISRRPSSCSRTWATASAWR